MSRWDTFDHHPPCPGGCGELADECACPRPRPLGSMRISEPIGSTGADRLLNAARAWQVLGGTPEVARDVMAIHMRAESARYSSGGSESVDGVSETIVPDTTGRRIAPTQQPTVHNPCPQPGEQE